MNRILALQSLSPSPIGGPLLDGSNQSNRCSSETAACSTTSTACGPTIYAW